MLDFQKLSAHYQQALLRQIVPFWLKHSRDERCGGYFDLLTATGEVIDGHKFVTQQAQQVWAFSWLYNTLDGQSGWLAHARHGAAFLSQFAHDDKLTCYAQLDRRGRPMIPSRDCVPDSFSLMAYAQFYRATGDDEWAMLAKQLFTYLCQRREIIRNEQAVIGSFQFIRHLSEPATFLKALLELRPLVDEEVWKQTTDAVVQEIVHEFVDRRTDTLRECILPGGAFVNTPEGRRLNVGLTFQTASYLLDFYQETASLKSSSAGAGSINRKATMQIVAWCLQLCEQAWDEATCGLNQYVDMKRQPSIFTDWQQKWAWVHVEAIASLVKGYVYTQHPDCLKWFKRIHDFTFGHFPDTQRTGWYLATDQHAQPLLPAKSIPAAGCFSLVRCLTETAQFLLKCERIQPTSQPSLLTITSSRSARQTT